MAGFKMHISTSTVLGIGYGTAAHTLFDVPLASSLLATGLCSVSGMLPDLDSGSGRPLKESMAFAAAVVPMMMVHRFARLGLTVESMVLACAVIYLLIRFGLAEMLRRYTVHRGMFHSVPAALIAAQLAFLVCASEDLSLRYFKAAAVLLGFMSHLVLDEIYSVEFYRGRMRLKKSFGTAIKFWGDNLWANVSTYAKLILMTYLMARDPGWMQQFEPPEASGQSQVVAEEPRATIRK